MGDHYILGKRKKEAIDGGHYILGKRKQQAIDGGPLHARKQKETQSAHAKSTEAVPLVEFMYLVFMCMPGESYRRQLRSLLLCLCTSTNSSTNSHVC